MDVRKTVRNMMQEHPLYLLYLCGFFSHLRPAEPFYKEYMTGPTKLFTLAEVKDQISPIHTYSLLLLMLPAILFADLCRYKPVIVFQGLCHVITYSLLCFASSFQAMQWLQVTSAMVTACDVSIHSYVYSMVMSDQHDKTLIYCRWFSLFGYAIGALGGKLLVSYGHFSYYHLNLISLGSASLALIFSVFLPTPSTDEPCSECLNRQIKKKDRNTAHCCCKVVIRFLKQQWQDIYECYSSSAGSWTIWWLLVTVGSNQVTNSSEMLWEKLQENSESVYQFNGGVETVAAVLGLLVFFVMGRIEIEWSHWGELAVSALCAVNTATIIAMAVTRNIWMAYAGYIVCKTTYVIINTKIIIDIAVNVTRSRYALVFGINKLASLLLQELVTLAMTFFSIDIYKRFYIYGCYFSVLMTIVVATGVITLIVKRKKAAESSRPPTEP